MAFLKKDEFAGLCFCTTSDLATYRRRGKIVLSGEFYDDTNEVNKAFVEYRKKFAPDAVEVLPAPKIEAVENKEQAPKIDKPAGKTTNFTELERIKLQLDNEKKEKEIEKLNIQVGKLNGILIPTDLAKLVIVQISKSMSTAFKQGADNLLVEFAATKNLSSKESADMRAKIVAITNTSVENALNESKKMIKNIVNEYSDTRSRGERK